jgi:hypothetical protein
MIREGWFKARGEEAIFADESIDDVVTYCTSRELFAVGAVSLL